MILLRLMHSFPTCRFSIHDDQDSDPWDVCLLHGALPVGMKVWLAERNLQALRRVGHDGYVIRWLAFGPGPERNLIAAVEKAAINYVEGAPLAQEHSKVLANQIVTFNSWRSEAKL